MRVRCCPGNPILSMCRLEALKAKVRKARVTSPLFNVKTFTHDLEELLLKMWHRHASGLPPDHIV